MVGSPKAGFFGTGGRAMTKRCCFTCLHSARRPTHFLRVTISPGARPTDGKATGANCWGITASDVPGPETLTIDGIERQFFDYVARGVPFGPDDGTLAPWAIVSSIAFAPGIVLPVIDHLIHELHLNSANR